MFAGVGFRFCCLLVGDLGLCFLWFLLMFSGFSVIVCRFRGCLLCAFVRCGVWLMICCTIVFVIITLIIRFGCLVCGGWFGLVVLVWV